MTTTGHPYTPIPDAFTQVRGSTQLEPIGSSTIADELPLYGVHLQAENKSRATVSLWTGAARQLHAYLVDNGMPTDVRAIRRESRSRESVTTPCCGCYWAAGQGRPQGSRRHGAHRGSDRAPRAAATAQHGRLGARVPRRWETDGYVT